MCCCFQCYKHVALNSIQDRFWKSLTDGNFEGLENGRFTNFWRDAILHQQLWSLRNKVFRTFVLQNRMLIENTVQELMTAFHNTQVLSSWQSDSTAGLGHLRRCKSKFNKGMASLHALAWFLRHSFWRFWTIDRWNPFEKASHTSRESRPVY